MDRAFLKNRRNQLLIIPVLLTVFAICGYLFRTTEKKPLTTESYAGKTVKLYWFIPDGLRADRSTFNIFQWAESGLMPNLRKMMDGGTYGYSMPVFPGHTPTNFATLLTGSTPKVHGIADGPMHIEGYPLAMVSKGGFSSIAKKVPPIWYTLEKNGLTSTLLSVPGSTPPEIDAGIVIRGRWGGWGTDFPAVIFHSAKDRELRREMGFGSRIFYSGSELTTFVTSSDPAGWQMDLPESYSPAREIALHNWSADVYGLIYDSLDDEVVNYDRVLFSPDKKNTLAELGVGDWSGWLPVNLAWEMQNDYNLFTPKRMAWERNLSAIQVGTRAAIHVIKLGRPDFFRIRFVYDSLNENLVKPANLASELHSELGPMIDFPDNYPPQLIRFEEDREAFLEESRRSLAWHREAARFAMERSGSDAVIHSIYTPNQMLTSRWWLGYLDPRSRRYGTIDQEIRAERWDEVKEMYQGIDEILGEILNEADEQTVIVFSSDHGIVPLDYEVRLNNYFAREGLLAYSHDEETGLYEIDWPNSRAVFLKMDNIYLNPDGLAGSYRRASGPAYEKLRDEVIGLLKELKDEDGQSPLGTIVKWEDAERVLSLPRDRIGDLVISNRPAYNWVEDMTADGAVFHEPLKSGYKQAVIPEEAEGMLTPFVILGPGVKKGHRLAGPVRHIDQYPTVMTLLDQPIPDFVEGRPIDEVFSEK